MGECRQEKACTKSNRERRSTVITMNIIIKYFKDLSIMERERYETHITQRPVAA